MKKVLIIINTSFVPYGGITTVVMNYYRKIDKSNVQIDIASTNEVGNQLKEEISKYSTNYYNLGKRKKVFHYTKKIKKLIEENKYDVVHVNGNSATMFLDLFPAKSKKVPLRIAHVHNSKSQHPRLNKFLKLYFKKTYNFAIAVSKLSGDWLYGDNYTVLNNAIDVEYYSYNTDIRKQKREELGLLDDEFVIGTVGKLNEQKNHEFLLRVFESVHKVNEKSKLIIVGGGDLEKNLRQLAKDLSIDDSVIFTGMVDDSRDYYQAFDFFALPSRYEGFGLSLVEAQSAGLKCVASIYVPDEANASRSVEFLDIKENYQEWADFILNNCHYDREAMALNAAKSIRKNGYDIGHEAKKLLEIYNS